MAIKPIGAVAEYVSQIFKGPIIVNDNQLTLALGITQILPNDSERVFLYFVNLSSNDVFVSPFSQPTATNGILLGANGGSISLNVTTDFQLVSHPWYVFSPQPSQTAFLLFGKRETKYAEET